MISVASSLNQIKNRRLCLAYKQNELTAYAWRKLHNI